VGRAVLSCVGSVKQGKKIHNQEEKEMKINSIKLLRLMSGTALATIAFGVMPVYAQTVEPSPAAPTDAAPADSQVVVVTGSRLASRGFKAPTPVTVFDEKEYKLSGAQTVEQVLNQSPQMIGSNNYGATGNLAPGTGAPGGTAALNMRGLGEQRNLVLVNGRRYAIADVSQTTDLNTIPTALLKRVEVVTGGSSAVYGSDAITGVANFIMKDDYQGLEVDAQKTWDEHTGTPTYSADIIFGANFADGRGNAVIDLNYYDRGGITRGDEGRWAYDGLGDGCVANTSWSDSAAGTALAVPSGQTCTQAGGRMGLVAQGSTNMPNGLFQGIPAYGSAQSNPALDAALQAAGLQNLTSFGYTYNDTGNQPRAAVNGVDFYNNQPTNYLVIPLRRWMVNSFFHYDINENATAYLEAAFTDNITQIQQAPPGASGNFLVETDNPYLSTEMQNVLQQLDLAETGTTTLNRVNGTFTTTPGDGLAILNIGRRTAELGTRTDTSEKTTFRTAFGVKGTVNGLHYDVYYSYARMHMSDSQTGNFSLTAFQKGLLSVNGAAPLINPFGPHISDAAAKALMITTKIDAESERQVLAGNLSGTAFNLPAGPVDFNTGFEYRRDSAALNPDALLGSGDISGFGTFLPTGGSVTVKEVYGEVRVPILADLPFVKRLSVTGAARYSDYSLSGVGGVWTSSLGSEWQVNDDLTFRAQEQRAIRAPNIGELYAGQSIVTPGATDPCSSRAPTAQQTDAVRALCIATGVPASEVFGTNVQPNFVSTLTGGNPNVSEETSNTTTFGAVITPAFIPGLAISIDYFKIDLEGAISTLGGGVANTFNLCYYSLQDANSEYCKAIHRDPATGQLSGYQNGNYYVVDQFNANTGGIKTSGIDFDGRYAFDVPFKPFSGSSRIDIDTAWTYTQEYTFQPVQSLDLYNKCVGAYGSTCGNPAPKWKGVTRVTWHNGPVTVSLHDRYIGKVYRDTYLFAQRTGQKPDANNYTAAILDAVHYIDMSITASLPARTEIYGGINNLFDKAPPLTGSAQFLDNTWPGTYDVYGRTFYVGVRKHF
jgi:iron complex outermembrane receptor protein